MALNTSNTKERQAGTDWETTEYQELNRTADGGTRKGGRG